MIPSDNPSAIPAWAMAVGAAIVGTERFLAWLAQHRQKRNGGTILDVLHRLETGQNKMLGFLERGAMCRFEGHACTCEKGSPNGPV